MKHQYFGDVNDYRKYGLLENATTIWPSSGRLVDADRNDDRSDGRFIDYLKNPKRWRHFDPTVYDALAAAVPVRRSVDVVREHDILAGAAFAERPSSR